MTATIHEFPARKVPEPPATVVVTVTPPSSSPIRWRDVPLILLAAPLAIAYLTGKLACGYLAHKFLED